MTSKEALQELFIRVSGCIDNEKYTTSCCREIVMKDLELLEQYKSIEKDLGIDLTTLFKVLNAKKVYHKKYGYYDMCSIDIKRKEIWFNNEKVKDGKPLHYEKLKDYNKTWWLEK